MDIQFLAHNLFGYKINEGEFRQRFEQCSDKELLQRVTVRTRFIDLLRFRTSFKRSYFLNGGHAGYLVDIEKQGLELYLLCTCIDALSGETDFLDFPTWLQVGTSQSKKNKYHIKDDKIKEILGNDAQALLNPDIFRNKAAKLYSEVYLSNFGNSEGFLQFFEELPNAAKEILAESYFISDLLKEDYFSNEKDEVTEINGHKGFSKYTVSLIKEKEKWKSKNNNEKVNIIGKYLYIHRRNAYTHKSEGWASQVFDDPNEDPQLGPILNNPNSNWQPVELQLAENGKYRFLNYKASHNEDEALLIRLIVSLNVLVRLGFEVNSEYIKGFRQYLLYRKNLYMALHEFDEVFNILRYFGYDVEIPALLLNQKEFPLFPCVHFKRILIHTIEIWPNHKNWLNSYIDIVEGYNIQIAEFNTEFLQLYKSYENSQTLEDHNTMMSFRNNTFMKLKYDFEIKNVFAKAQSIYDWINGNADRMEW